MNIRNLGAILLVTLALGGCGNNPTKSPGPTPTPEGKSATVRFTVTYAANQNSQIDTYLEANIYASGVTGLPIGTTNDQKVKHTKGLISQQDYRITAGPIDDSKTYVLMVNVYDDKTKKILLYRGTCPSDPNCEVITQNHPSSVDIVFAEATDLETIYQHSVGTVLRRQCAIRPNPSPCKRPLNRIYYDSNQNTCNYFSWTGCDVVAPFANMALCQQACIK